MKARIARVTIESHLQNLSVQCLDSVSSCNNRLPFLRRRAMAVHIVLDQKVICQTIFLWSLQHRAAVITHTKIKGGTCVSDIIIIIIIKVKI